MDAFTKWAEAIPLKTHTATDVADALMRGMFARFGVPRVLHSDRAPENVSILLKEVARLLQVHKSFSVVYHPEGNGQVERQMRTIQNLLAPFVNEACDDWRDHVDFVMEAY